MNIEHEITLTDAEKKKDLFFQQKKTLDTFLGTGAISQAQYNKSLHDLAEKMGYQNDLEDSSPHVTHV